MEGGRVFLQKKQTKQTKPRRRTSVLLAIPFLAIVAASVTIFVNQQIDINKLNQEKAAVTAKLEAQQQENNALSDIIEGGNQDDYIERIARERYGYVKPDERVYYDIS